MSGDQFLTPDGKWNNDTEPETPHNHAAQRKNAYCTPSIRSCPGCEAKGELFHFRDNCPIKNIKYATIVADRAISERSVEP